MPLNSPVSGGEEAAKSPMERNKSALGANTLGQTRRFKLNDLGQLEVVITNISTPPAGTPIDINIFNNVGSTSGIDTDFLIPNGTVLTVQALSGGSEFHSSGSIVELFEDPSGTGSPLTRIETIFVNGSSDSVIVGKDFVGDGNRRIILRRRRYANNPKEMWGRWRGFTV